LRNERIKPSKVPAAVRSGWVFDAIRKVLKSIKPCVQSARRLRNSQKQCFYVFGFWFISIFGALFLVPNEKL
jgi:hypothetical protein